MSEELSRRRATPSVRLVAVVACALALSASGCGGERVDDESELGTSVIETPPASPAPPPATAEPPELDTPEAAVATLAEYYQAIAGGDYVHAYSLWGGGGEASGQTFGEFERGFAETASVSVEIGAPGRVEGAAGSRYVQIPVTLRATLIDGTEQCFRGTYTLRRSVVPGATADQRLWRIDSGDLAPCDGAAGEVDEDGEAEAGDGAAPPAVVALVTRLGERLDNVSLLAPPETLRAQIRAEYAPLVTPDLLETWLADPSTAPGRQTSSPSPDRIEVLEVTPSGDGAYTVRGDVVYVTSVERTQGGAAHREPVELTVLPAPPGGWRIAAYERQ